MNNHTLTLAQLAKGLRAREFSSVELVRGFLDRIEAFQPKLNAMITILREPALAAAQSADRELAAGRESPLTGLPILHKDLFCTEGVLTTCGSHMLDNFVSPYDATVVAKLKAAGAITLGKTNMDEFAMGSSNETSYFGPVRNPWNTDLVPGGSSGGSAAAVAARLAPAATATDTGGSIRQPAALCGVTGIKPTYGRVSRYGMIAFASSLDQGGVIACTAADAALILREMSGFDANDSTSVDLPVPDYLATLDAPLAGLKIGLLKEFFDTGLDPGNEKSIREALALYERLGATLREVSLPNLPLSVPAYYVVAPAECSSNLARFDGVRFGHRAKDPRDLMDLYKRSRGEGFGAEVKRRIMTGTYVPLGRLLRCVLSQGAEGPAAHQCRLQTSLRRGGCVDGGRRHRRRRFRSVRRRRTRSPCISTISTRSARTSRGCPPCRFRAGSRAVCRLDCRSSAPISARPSC